jgi:hypothetical protein
MSSSQCKVKASIVGQTNKYRTGPEAGQEILEISLSKPGYYQYHIPWRGDVAIKLVIGPGMYSGNLNLKRKDRVPWISPVVHDSNGGKLRLRTPWTASGYTKGSPVSLKIDVNKKEISIL